MTCLAAPVEVGSISILGLILVSVRRWREARDTGVPVQPHLFAQLSRDGDGILAPVLDSLMHLYESVLRRPLRVGRDDATSQDEELLLDLLIGDKTCPDSFTDIGGLSQAFEAALASTRIMVRKAFRLPVVS